MEQEQEGRGMQCSRSLFFPTAGHNSGNLRQLYLFPTKTYFIIFFPPFLLLLVGSENLSH